MTKRRLHDEHPESPGTTPQTAVQSQHADASAPDRMLLIVVGASLQSEIAERPLASELRDAVEHWQAGAVMAEDIAHDADELIQPVICTDVWYLNDASLGSRPVICVGPPEHNAATAWFANKLPTAFVLEGSYRVQLDPEWLDLTACIWGVRASDTAAAIRLFCERYLEDFLRAAIEA